RLAGFAPRHSPALPAPPEGPGGRERPRGNAAGPRSGRPPRNVAASGAGVAWRLPPRRGRQDDPRRPAPTRRGNGRTTAGSEAYLASYRPASERVPGLPAPCERTRRPAAAAPGRPAPRPDSRAAVVLVEHKPAPGGSASRLAVPALS